MLHEVMYVQIDPTSPGRNEGFKRADEREDGEGRVVGRGAAEVTGARMRDHINAGAKRTTGVRERQWWMWWRAAGRDEETMR